MARWNGSVLDINAAVAELADKRKGLLGMNAHSGCNTVSYPNGIWKESTLRVLTQMDINKLHSVLRADSATQRNLEMTGIAFVLSLCCQKERTSLNAAGTKYTERGREEPACTSYCVCELGNDCCNPHTQREESEGDPQQSEVLLPASSVMDFVFRRSDGSHVSVDTVHPSLLRSSSFSSPRWYHLQSISSDLFLVSSLYVAKPPQSCFPAPLCYVLYFQFLPGVIVSYMVS